MKHLNQYLIFFMTKIIKITEGTASFLQTEVFANEADAQVGEEPETREFKINEIKIENTKWKQKQ